MGIDPEKLFVLFVIALVVLGPERLPQAARALGRGLAHVRRYSALLRAEVDDVLAEPRAIIHSAAREVEMEQARLRSSHEPVAEQAPLINGAGSPDGSLGAKPVPGEDQATPYRPGPLQPMGLMSIDRSAPDDPSLN